MYTHRCVYAEFILALCCLMDFILYIQCFISLVKKNVGALFWCLLRLFPQLRRFAILVIHCAPQREERQQRVW